MKSLLTNKAEQKTIITDNQGRRFVQIDMANRLNTVMHAATSSGALTDRGANGGIGGADMKVMETMLHTKADISGIGSNVLKNSSESVIFHCRI